MCEEAGERVLRLGFSLPELQQGKLPKGKWASFDYAFGEVITINEKKPKGGWKKAVDEQYQNQWHSHKNPILHELGHYIHYSNDKFYENERWEKPGRYGVTTDDIGQLVSLYAKKSRTEFEAELMAGILSGKVYPESILRCSYMLEKKGSPDERNLFNDIWEIASGEKPNTLVTEQKYGDMMKVLYQQEGSQLKISIMAENDVQDFINAHAQVLDNGFKYLPMSDAMRHRLERSNFIFSGFKTFHELNEAFPSLIDENGERKPFERFLKDVLAIDETYNRNYLRAEYNFCQASADMAAKWEQIEADGDRYNLQYRTQHDDKVRPEHAALDGVTLPPSDPFWESYYPPNGWNCRCTVAQVRKSKYPVTDPEEARARGEEALQKDTRGIFRFNSGKQGKTFPDYNPYTISRCRDCDIAQGKVNLAFVPENDLCAACKFIRSLREDGHEYDMNVWVHNYSGKNGDGYVMTERDRIPEPSADNNDIAKYKKEFGMCKVAADNGHKIEFLSENNRPEGQTYDIRFDGIPTELKATAGTGNIVGYYSYALHHQGAQAVLFRFKERSTELFKRLSEAKRKYGGRIFYYFENEEIITEF